jgi:segregation and condensation protein A
MPYEVQTPVFEGPFDLLLHLILRSQLDVYEISLAAIVDAYVTEMEHMSSLDLEIATEFLLIAATLVELKTRGLLPGRDDVDLDEELALWEQRDLLLSRLLECKTFKDASGELQRLAASAALSLPRTAGLEERFADVAPDLLAGITPEALRAAAVRALAPKPVPRVDMDHVAPIRLSVADAVVELVEILSHRARQTFRQLAAGAGTRLDVIVRFLAVLELFKQGLVELEQAETFGTLTVVWLGTPSAMAEAGLDTVDIYEG